MATSGEVQAQLGTTGRDPTIIRTIENSTGTTQYYVIGGASYPGKARWLRVNPADTAATQAAVIRLVLVGTLPG